MLLNLNAQNCRHVMLTIHHLQHSSNLPVFSSTLSMTDFTCWVEAEYSQWSTCYLTFTQSALIVLTQFGYNITKNTWKKASRSLQAINKNQSSWSKITITVAIMTKNSNICYKEMSNLFALRSALYFLTWAYKRESPWNCTKLINASSLVELNSLRQWTVDQYSLPKSAFSLAVTLDFSTQNLISLSLSPSAAKLTTWKQHAFSGQ